jgi:hypothetical protein
MLHGHAVPADLVRNHSGLKPGIFCRKIPGKDRYRDIEAEKVLASIAPYGLGFLPAV